MLAGWSVSSFYHISVGNRSKSDPCSYELFCLESHVLSFPKVLQIPPESPCIYIYVCVYVCMCVCVCMCIYIYTYIYIYHFHFSGKCIRANNIFVVKERFL